MSNVTAWIVTPYSLPGTQYDLPGVGHVNIQSDGRWAAWAESVNSMPEELLAGDLSLEDAKAAVEKRGRGE